MRHPASLQERRKSAGASLLMSQVGARRGGNMRHPRRIPAREDGIARSDIRVPEAKQGRVPCRNEGEYRLPLCHLLGRVGGACTFLKRHQGARALRGRVPL